MGKWKGGKGKKKKKLDPSLDPYYQGALEFGQQPSTKRKRVRSSGPISKEQQLSSSFPPPSQQEPPF